MIKRIFILSITFIIFQGSFANPMPILQANNLTITSAPKPTLDFSADAYRLLYENQLKSNDAVLKTIFYALGGLATAMLLVFASNWWFNEKRVTDIAKSINSDIDKAKNEALTLVVEKMGLLHTEKTAALMMPNLNSNKK